MGLDMNLTKRVYVGKRNVSGTIDITMRNEKLNIDLSKVVYIVEELAYWRKANHIHKWMVANVQDGVDDCGTYYVGEEKINALLKACKDVVSKQSDPEKILPTARGFFFGGTEYDYLYYSDVKYTIEVLEGIISDWLKGHHYDVFYSSSW